jgi:hypothetical protein
MKVAITCVQIQLEVTRYNDAGQVMPRPRVEPFVVFEADLPEAVREWLASKLQKEA